VEIPEGEPDALRAAAGAWEAASDIFDEQAGSLDSTTLTVTLADWQGAASAAYASAATSVWLVMHDGAASCRDAAVACRRFARELHDAKHEARQAKRDAEDAIERGRKAEDLEASARGAAAVAADRAERAALTAVKARAAGPAGEIAAQGADADAAAASREAQRASDDAAAYHRIVEDAVRDLTAARKRGELANHHARTAARAAVTAFDSVAAAAQPPAVTATPAVPVTVQPMPNPLSDPFAPLALAGRTPSDVRRAQIAAAEERRRAAEKAREGGFDDAFGGMAVAWLGTDLGIGDSRTKAYQGNRRWNELLTFVPTPAGARSQVERRIAKEGVEQTARHAPAFVQRARQFWTKSHVFEGTKVHQRDDLIDLARADSRGRSNAERMERGLAPIGPDGKALELHHTTQRHDGAVAEVTNEFHKRYSRELHINPNTVPSGIDRREFDAWRRRYWSDRLARLRAP
jgi:hypothetical protein